MSGFKEKIRLASRGPNNVPFGRASLQMIEWVPSTLSFTLNIFGNDRRAFVGTLLSGT